MDAEILMVPQVISDKRLKLMEIAITLGGFLGIILALLQDQLPTGAKDSFAGFIVLFIVVSILSYSVVMIPAKPKAIRIFLALFSAVFSGLLSLAISIPLSSSLVDVAILSKAFVGINLAELIYVVLFLVITFGFYEALTRAMMLSFNKMAPRNEQKQQP